MLLLDLFLPVEREYLCVAYVDDMPSPHTFQGVDHKYSLASFIPSFELNFLEVAFTNGEIFIYLVDLGVNVEISLKLFNFVDFHSWQPIVSYLFWSL